MSQWIDFPEDQVISQMEWEAAGRAYRRSVVLMDKTLAERLLKLNKDNRAPKRRIINLIKLASELGRYYINGSTIVFAHDPHAAQPIRMIDGQNRCLAIFEGDLEVIVEILEGADLAAQPSIGEAVVNSIVDVLGFRGLTTEHLTELVAAGKMLYRTEMGATKQPIPKEVVANYVESHLLELEPIVGWAMPLVKMAPFAASGRGGRIRSKILTMAPLVVLVTYMTRNGADPVSVQRFFTGIASGMYSNEHDQKTFSAIRSRLTEHPLLSGGASQTNLLLSEMAGIVWAYNRWVQGDTVHAVKTVSGGKPKKLGELPQPVRTTPVQTTRMYY